MRTLTPIMAAEVAKQSGGEFRPLVSITAPDGSATRYLATETRTIDSTAFAGELLALSDIDYRPGRSSDVRLEVVDNADNRAAVVLGATVRIQLWPAPGALADASTVFSGEVSDPFDRGGGTLSFDVVALSTRRYNKRIGQQLEAATFPGAVKADQGRTLTVGFGHHRRLTCVPVDAGSVTRLAQALSDSETGGLELTDADEFPATGTVQVSAEQITYTGKTGNRLTGLGRAANGTNAVEHQPDSVVAEIQIEFVYVALDHRGGMIDAVYVDGVRQVGRGVTLGAALSDSETASATVSSTANLPSAGSFKVGSEWIGYAGILSGTTLGPLTRGINASDPAAHSNGAAAEVVEWQALSDYVFDDLVINGDFDSAAGWVLGTGWSIAGGLATAVAGPGSRDLRQAIAGLAVGRQYVLEVTAAAVTTPATFVAALAGNTGQQFTVTANSVSRHTITAGNIDSDLILVDGGLFAGSLDRVRLGRPRTVLKFFAAPLIQRLGSIEVADSIDVTDPGHSHAGTIGNTTATLTAVGPWLSSVAGNPPHTGISNGGNAGDGDLNTFATLDTSINVNSGFSTYSHTIAGGTANRVPSSMVVEAKMNASYTGTSIPQTRGRLFINGQYFAEIRDFQAAGGNLLQRTISMSAWTDATAMVVLWDPVNLIPVQEYLFEVRIISITYQDTGTAPAVTSVAKVGTVLLTGATSGEFIIGREVQVDVAGYLDDSVGQWTGTPNALIERPDQVVRALLSEFAHVPINELAASRFDAFTGEAMRLPITAPERVRTVLAEVEKQLRAIVYHDGDGWVMQRRPDSADAAASSPDFDLQDGDLLRNEDGPSSLSLGVVGLAQLTTRIEWRASPRHDGGWEYAGLAERGVAQYGAREAVLELTLIDDEPLAESITDWHLGRLSEPDRPVAVFSTMLRHFASQLGDLARVRSTLLPGVDVAGDIVGQRLRLTGNAAGTIVLTVESGRLGSAFELTVAEVFPEVYGFRQGVGGAVTPATFKGVPFFQFAGNPDPGTGEMAVSFGLAGMDQVPGVNTMRLTFVEAGAPPPVVLTWFAGLSRYGVIDAPSAEFVKANNGQTITYELTALS